MREASMRGDSLGLSEDEMAFFDALATNDSAAKVMGDDQLKVITLDLVETVRRNATIDWTAKESVKANLRVMIRRTLRKYGYPPDLQDEAVQTVLRQAEQMARAA
jgi:type I restriction enzyme R subunit